MDVYENSDQIEISTAGYVRVEVYLRFELRICVKYIKIVYWPKYSYRVRWLIIVDAADAIFISRSFSLNIIDSDKKKLRCDFSHKNYHRCKQFR